MVTALEARRVRLLSGKPMAEVLRWWTLESWAGRYPDRRVPLERAAAPTDYRELAQLERVGDGRIGRWIVRRNPWWWRWLWRDR
jgi:hypothetical protein